MSKLNQAKIVSDLEALLVNGNKEDFICDFLLAYGTPKAAIKRLKMEHGQRNVATIEEDIALAQKIYFRPLKQGASPMAELDAICKLPLLTAHKIRFIVVTDFTTVAAYDRKVDDTAIFGFNELPNYYEFFLPLTGKYDKVLEHTEHPADVKACEKMGRLYDTICAANNYGKDDLHTLNVFLTRLLFCFFAEDTDIFPQKNQMTNAIQNLTEDGDDLTDFFSKLFTVLNLPNNDPARKKFSAIFQAFPYVNGDLFEETIVMPQFNPKARRLLIECGKMTWSDISPVIFGSMFQEVMDPEKRRERGAHYTSEKNILKVIQPLFLDALREEFEGILQLSKDSIRNKALEVFRTKLGSLGFLDPACGCGNFLIVSYRKLRELEIEVLSALQDTKAQSSPRWMNVDLLSKVSIDQFHGIELEEFPTQIARVSMWLTEHVMNVKLGQVFGQVIPSIPLKHAANIVCANALTIPWEDVVAPDNLHYIFGNPPFSGARLMDSKQKNDLVNVVLNEKTESTVNLAATKDLDYITAWFFKAAQIMQKNAIQTAFVSTNSICQGEQVAPVWNTLKDCYDIKINFAYQTFKWGNEARGGAAVHCVIVGFSRIISQQNVKVLFSENTKNTVDYISPYLIGIKSNAVKAIKKPLCDVPSMKFGSQPRDGGHFVLSLQEKGEIVNKSPNLKSIIRPYIGVDEYLHNDQRFCVWLHHETINFEDEILSSIIERVKKFRLNSTAKTTNQYAKVPHLFAQIAHPYTDYLIVPSTSSENRKYIPIGFQGETTIASNALQIIPNATLYHFGILTSLMHMTWMRTVCGRLKSDYRYSASIVYNTFPWPQASQKQQTEIESLAQNILDIRDYYPDMTLAQMYNPETMPEDLQKAHTALDVAVDALYRKKPFADDAERLQVLFKMYEELIQAQN